MIVETQFLVECAEAIPPYELFHATGYVKVLLLQCKPPANNTL
jgi:hypothetical protein